MLKKPYYFFLIIFIFFVGAIFVYMHQGKDYPITNAKTVHIIKEQNSFQLIRNGKPFYIKGASGKSYIKELSEAGGNTLRLYDTINLQKILDEATKYNIAVIVDIPLPRFNNYVNFYSDTEFKKVTKIKVKNLIYKYKNHPSLLMWNIGNELTYPLPINNKRKKFINFFNELIDLIHEEDKNHPVSTTLEGPFMKQAFKINRFSPNIDLIGYNVFSMIEKVKLNQNKLSYITSTVPYFISEWGVNGPWEASKNNWMAILEQPSTEKGAEYKDVYNKYIKTDNQCLGSLAFYWGYKEEGTPTWFNIFDKSGKKSQSYYSLKEVWSDSLFNNIGPPLIEEIKINGKSDNNLVFNVAENVMAEILINPINGQELEFKWEIYESGWKNKGWKLNNELNAFVFQKNAINTSKVKIIMPKKEGAYRIFVYVYDVHNNFASANIPFYILNQNE